MFEGVHTALVTPFKNGVVDESTFQQLVDRQFDADVQGIVPVGTTGESPTLDTGEHIRVIEMAAQFAQGRGHVIAGTGANSTKEAIQLTQAAEKVGATASLQVAPYYNKPSQEGLFQHFKAIADQTSLKIVLYSIPGRCGIPIGVETVVRLAEACPNIVAIKEAGGTPERVSELDAALTDDFEILSGDDSLTLPFMSVGARGVISVASNLIPAEMVSMVRAAQSGDWEHALQVHRRFYPLFSAFLKLDTNPVPIKTAMGIAGFIDPALRLPMVGMAPEKAAELRAILDRLDLLS
ncbi:MAG: 4-hydroxy-tetrahydrodipicolinate synthase [Verrucomicrobiae bacterium]|nr:4-hydroxy-tetrahydrodipicolinate synthase [Verrucomicrobiae bacterium]